MRKLERRYPGKLQVVSVHSPKFPTERETEALRAAILRLRIDHPVVNDADFQMWQTYDNRAWPTLLFVDPKGNIIGKHEGEIVAESIDGLIRQWIEQYDQNGDLVGQPLDLTPENAAGSGLLFPGKVHYDDKTGRLFIADSNHDRIVVSNLDGDVEQVIGGADIGRNDGPADVATFNQPQGLALGEGGCWVADVENHSIRRIDLKTWETVTMAGTGTQSYVRPQRGAPMATALNSPWDVAVHDGTLYIAMAGSHQLWSMPLTANDVGPWAGSMAEGIVDGPRAEAELAQPSGLAIGPSGVTFADSESSGVREVTFADERVQTFIGRGLFEFGDQDGDRDVAKLQHPLDVAWVGDDLYVADTFNHKIKQVFPGMQQVRTLTGGLGMADGPLSDARFNEPGGLCTGPGHSLIVADTNNHRIRLLDLDQQDVRTIPIDLDGPA
ncbi:MAG: alkyl hydroperoxide reductase [Chloroflexi bacterium]|nr:alkyl hydroperoxide reductase [Chloroflexota bacterium]